MGLHYFDIETLGFNPKEDRIISVQIQPIFDNGEPRGALEIYKSFGSGGNQNGIPETLYTEDDIVSMMWNKLMCGSVWDFIPVGFNLKFDFKFLNTKFKEAGREFDTIDLFDRPYIDLHPLAVLINKGSFKNSGLDHVSEKMEDGKNIPEWYRKREYDKIEAYVKQETESFLKFYRKYFNLLSGTGVVKHG